ncbi:MAG: hypothetical protein ACKVOX_16975 [Rhizobacter sp.]
MAMTLRLPPELHAKGQAYSEKLGISLTALLAVALRDYLDGRRAMPQSVEPLKGVTVAKPSSKLATSDPLPVQVPSSEPLKPAYRRPVSLSDPCPCGAKTWDGHRVKWKHCHGKA